MKHRRTPKAATPQAAASIEAVVAAKKAVDTHWI